MGIKKRRFFVIVAKYKSDPKNFSIQYTRKTKAKISQGTEKNIIKELKIEKGLIQDKNVPLKSYNYSYIKNRLEDEYNQKVSVTTIIKRAKKNGFYLKKKPKKSHDREVITNYAGDQASASIYSKIV